MSPVTHFLLSWAVAEGTPNTTPRQRMLIAVGGIIPDLDGLGAIPDTITRWASETPTRYFHEYHHLLGHNVAFAALCTALAFALVDRGQSLARRALVAGLVCLTFHLHLLCDVLGAKGPDGSQWPIPYLEPFSSAWQWTWSGQWELNDPRNIALTLVLILAALVLAVRRGYSFLEIFSTGLDSTVVTTLRARFAPQLLEEPQAEEPQEPKPGSS